MAKYGCPTKFITIIRQLHDGMQANLQSHSLSPMEQGCVLAPTLFSLMFPAMLTDTFKGVDIGIGNRRRFDDLVFRRRLQTKTKVKSDTINDLLLADDCAPNATSEVNMQHSVDRFSESCDNFGLTISTKKSEVKHQPAPGKPYIEPNITINDQRLNAVDEITYLGSTLSRNVVIDYVENTRLA